MLWVIMGDLIANSSAERATIRPTAMIRIERAAVASREEWERNSRLGRREVVIRDQQGRALVLKLIEYQ